MPIAESRGVAAEHTWEIKDFISLHFESLSFLNPVNVIAPSSRKPVPGDTERVLWARKKIFSMLI